MNDTYVVKKGDTLYGISNQFGVSVTELASLNNVDANSLQVGQTLIIPSKSGVNPDNMFMYTVKRGDTLFSIAKKYGISVESIKKLNYLDSNNLYIGQVLRIPEMYTKPEDMIMPEFVSYTVKKGDSLYTIARNYNTTVDAIIKDNSLSNSLLSVGQNLKIRIPKSSAVVEECFGEEYVPPVNTSFQNYTVQKGDSLYTISRKFNTSVSDLMQLNNLNSNSLSIGQVLKIPISDSSNTNKTYTVQRGDSLYTISRKFNTTVDNIKRKNNLTSNLLNVGQILYI